MGNKITYDFINLAKDPTVKCLLIDLCWFLYEFRRLGKVFEGIELNETNKKILQKLNLYIDEILGGA